MQRRITLGLGLGALGLALLWSALPATSSTTVDAVEQASDASTSRTGPSRTASSTAAPTAAAAFLSAAPRAAPEGSAWHDDRVMVRANALSDVLADHGLELMRPPGASGWSLVAVPQDASPVDVLAELRLDSRVGAAAPVGRLVAVKRGGKWTEETSADGGADEALSSETLAESADSTAEFDPDALTAWYRDAIDVPATDASALSEVVVAVLDTGVTTSAWTDADGVSHAAPASLADVDVVHAYDVVEGDDTPQDEHGHGTHTASLIVGGGAVPGIADGATLMPVRILDADAVGDEWSLIEGLTHAVDNGAHIVNLSVAFPVGYQPSVALHEALSDTRDAGVLIFAAAGNESAGVASWPAASSRVFGIGAAVPDGSGDFELASYSNLGTAVDLLSPGGDLSLDTDGDGNPDGLLAETISATDPGTTGLAWMAGTSQATAVATGIATHLLAQGVTEDVLTVALQSGANSYWTDLTDGAGAGLINGRAALDKVAWNQIEDCDLERHDVSLLPYIRDNGDGTVSPVARVSFPDSSKQPRQTFGTFHGTTTESYTCTAYKRDSGCEAVGSPVTPGDDGVVWTVTLDAIDCAYASTAPIHVLTPDDGFVAAVEALGELGDDALLGWWWEAGEDADLGDLVEHYSLLSLGTGYDASPMGIVFTPDASSAEVESYDFDLDGSGFSSSPVGTSRTRRLSGVGFSSSPVGTSRTIMLRGSGFSTSPIGTALTVHGGGGTRLRLSSASVPDDYSDTDLAARVESGGWLTATHAGVEAISATADGSMTTTIEDNASVE